MNEKHKDPVPSESTLAAVYSGSLMLGNIRDDL